MFFFLFTALFAGESKNIEMDIIYYENDKKIIQSHVLTQSGKEAIFTNVDINGKLQNFRVIANIIDGDEVHIDLARLDQKNKVLNNVGLITFDNISAEVATEEKGKESIRFEIRPSILK